MSNRRVVLAVLAVALSVATARLSAATNGGWTVVGWNNLGMHCMDSDFSVFSILPPYNTIHAQVMDPSGNLVTSAAGITVTYEAVADPTGSINTTSQGKSNFWQFAQKLFGLAGPLPADKGLTGVAMPGAANAPRPMTFDPAYDWFIAEGIPITPYDDAKAKNPYPMMRLLARDASGAVLATTDIVLPVSDEMDCRACHASGSGSAARPSSGWVNEPNPERDYRLNILSLHDERRGTSASYQTALTHAGYLSTGLYATAVGGTPILCAACHGSNALATTGAPGVPQLTLSVHSLHAAVTDPTSGMTLDNTANRSACYRCHPGSTTKCLRGAMGSAVAADGSMEMQCQSCHGPMSTVGTAGRQGWLDEPTCQNCHTGTAVSNNGQIRYTTVFDSNGQRRVAVNPTFATNPDTPVSGYSLYRFSAGHGGVRCEGCHGSTHAEYPSSHLNDNVQSQQLQGHKGVLVECATCHATVPTTTNGGPHGMHPVGQAWVASHHDAAGDGRSAACQACHGTDYRGTVLSRVQGDRTISAFGTKSFWKGFQVGCYTCHSGPGSDDANPNRPPLVANASASTSQGAPVKIQLSATDPDGNALTLRVVSQPAHGTAGLAGTTATYFPDPAFTGTDSFTFAAWDGSTNSNLGTATVAVAGVAACTVSANATVPGTAVVGQSVTFKGSATTQGCTSPVAYDWSFGDGAADSTLQSPTHAYASAKTYTWRLTASTGNATSSVSGTIAVTVPACTITITGTAPTTATVGRSVTFPLAAATSGCSGTPAYDMNFGDGTRHATTADPSHTYKATGTYTWVFKASIGSASATASGKIAVSSLVRHKY